TSDLRGALQRAMKDEDVPRDLRHALRDQQLARLLEKVRQALAIALLDAAQELVRLQGELELVLVADAGRGVDAVDDDVRLVPIDELVERGRRVVGLRREDFAKELVVRIAVGDDVGAAAVLELLGVEDV